MPKGSKAATTKAKQTPYSSKRRRTAREEIPYLPLPQLPDPVSAQTGDLFVWGSSEDGQLGLGAHTEELSKPYRHPWVETQIRNSFFESVSSSGIASLAAGGLSTLLLHQNGSVWSSGGNDKGALGRVTLPEGTTLSSEDADQPQYTSSRQFRPVKSLVDASFCTSQITAGDSFGAALSTSGDFEAWGSFQNGEGKFKSLKKKNQKRNPEHMFVSISAGTNHLLALSTQGHLYSMGMGQLGQLGRRISPRQKDELAPFGTVFLDSRSQKAVRIGTGWTTGFAVDDEHGVWAWGANGRGQLGLGEGLMGEIVERPKKIVALSPSELGGEDNVVQICGGEFHTLFLTRLGRVYGCGDCSNSQLGLLPEQRADLVQNASPVPVRIYIPEEGEDPIAGIACGSRCSLVVTREGALWSWGVGTSGELGLGKDSTSSSPIEAIDRPTIVVRRTGGRFATHVSCGGQHVVALLKRRE